MNLEFDPKRLAQVASHFLYRYHIVLFVLIVIGSLAIATFLLNSAMSPAPISSPETSKTSSFDTKTMDKIDALRTTSTPLVLPTGKRTNPFN